MLNDLWKDQNPSTTLEPDNLPFQVAGANTVWLNLFGDMTLSESQITEPMVNED